MILGYTLKLDDNKCNMMKNFKPTECSKYQDIYTINFIDANFKLGKIRKELSSTYDGYTIASEKFRNFCEKNNYSGIQFVALPNEPDFYWLKIDNIFEYDTIAAGTRFLNLMKLVRDMKR